MKFSRLVLVLALAAGISAPAHAAGLPLKKSQLVKLKVKKKKVLCGLLGSAWKPVKKAGHGYAVDKKASAAAKKACNSLLKQGALISLSQLPSIADIAKSRAGHGASLAAISGTPPALSEIPGLDVASLFWRDGVISSITDGVADQTQCGEFWSGTSDGASGGLNACFMTQAVGYSFAALLQQGNSLCYMKNAPTADNLAAGGLSLESGTFPDGDVTHLFNPPESGDSRVVKVNITAGEAGGVPLTMFVRVSSASANAAAGNQYRYERWECSDGEDYAHHYERATVKLSGEYENYDAGADGGFFAHESTLSGWLVSSGAKLEFDTVKERSIKYIEDSGFGTQLTITPDNLILNKSYDSFGEIPRLSYAVSSFSGSDIAGLRFLGGAVKSSMQGDSGELDYRGAVEFRDSYYAAAPGSALAGKLSAVNLATDAFLNDQTPPEYDLSEYDCAAPADIEVSLDMSNETLAASVAGCEQEQLGDMQFCFADSAVQDALMNYPYTCMAGDLPSDPGDGGDLPPDTGDPSDPIDPDLP